MRSRADARVRLIAPVLLLLGCAAAAASPAPREGAPRAAPPGQAEIASALQRVRADPNLGAERTIRTLRWKESTAPKPRRRAAWVAWVAGLFQWLEQSARLVVWGVAGMAAAMLLVFLVRVLRTRGAAPAGASYAAPTHVRDLDIRPESLPDDIGGAARALWDRGEHRAALALLYRGMLSRLAHAHGVPIRDSSTEGECVVLAADRLTRPRAEYTAQLVDVWQRAVYGQQIVQAAAVHRLCDGFAPALDVSPPFGTASGSAT